MNSVHAACDLLLPPSTILLPLVARHSSRLGFLLAYPQHCGRVAAYEIGFYTARFDSPRKDTNCYKLQEILDKLHLAVKEDNPSAIEALLPLVTDLTAGFKALFPEDVKK